jgi:hypothetical protein
MCNDGRSRGSRLQHRHDEYADRAEELEDAAPLRERARHDLVGQEVGDRVTRGQQLALLGNSGNTTAPHLHFHVMDAPLELGADRNLPYVFDAFDYQGFLDAADGTPSLLTTPEAREDELPLAFSVVTFAAPEGE